MISGQFRNPVLHRSNFLLGGQGNSWKVSWCLKFQNSILDCDKVESNSSLLLHLTQFRSLENISILWNASLTFTTKLLSNNTPELRITFSLFYCYTLLLMCTRKFSFVKSWFTTININIYYEDSNDLSFRIRTETIVLHQQNDLHDHLWWTHGIKAFSCWVVFSVYL